VRYQAALRPDKTMLMNFILTDFFRAGIPAFFASILMRQQAGISVSVIKNRKSGKQRF
jgi:hypothetical protein